MKKFSFSVIISHFAPKQNGTTYFSILLKTIESVRKQNFSGNVEIILCDDGSFWSKQLFEEEELVYLSKLQLVDYPMFKELDIDKYYGYPDVGKYRGVALKHLAILEANSENILILDDDHPLLRKKTLFLLTNYLRNYFFIRMRVIGPNYRPQLFSSPNAQGTSYAFKKEIFINTNGFSNYLFDNGYGEDNDILMKMYLFHCKLNRKSGYAGNLFTRDHYSNRWKDRSEYGIDDTERSKDIYLRDKNFKKIFFNLYGCDPYKNNSRKKNLWVEHTSFPSVAFELVFTIVSLFYYPLYYLSRLKKIIK